MLEPRLRADASRAAPDYAADQPTPNCARLRNTVARHRGRGRAAARRGGAASSSGRSASTNTTDRPRRLTLTSYRELAVHELGAYARDPDFNAMHVETWFVAPPAGAVRPQPAAAARPGACRRRSSSMRSRLGAGGASRRLRGFADALPRPDRRSRDPQGLRPGRARAVDDEGSLYTFDPGREPDGRGRPAARAARCDLVFVTGYGPRRAACGRDRRRTTPGRRARAPPSSRARLDRARAPSSPCRRCRPRPGRSASTPDGDRAHLTPATPRPWAHVLANADGYGTVVSNEGEIHSFNANARQNALTPFRFESVPTAVPGQLIYVVDLETGEADTAGFVPFRRDGRALRGHLRAGHRRPSASARGDIELVLTVFVAAGRARRHAHPDDPQPAPRDRQLPRRPLFRHGARRERRGQPRPARGGARRDHRGAALHQSRATTSTRAGPSPRPASPPRSTETVRTRFLGGAGRDLTNPFMVDKGGPTRRSEDDGRRVAAFAGTIDGRGRRRGGRRRRARARRPRRAEAVTMAARPARPRRRPAPRSIATRAWWAERLNDIRIETNDPGLRPAGQPLAALPGAGVAPVGPQRPQPARRRLRLPRPAAGRAAVHLLRSQPDPAADRLPCRGAVPRGRRVQMVARGARRPHRPGPAHPRLRPASLAALCRHALYRGHRRPFGAGRDRPPISKGPPCRTARSTC